MPAADEEAITAKKPVAPARKPAPAAPAGNAAQAKKRRPDPDEDEEAPRHTSKKVKARAEEDDEDQDEEDLSIKKKKKKKKAGSKKGMLIALGAGGGVLLLVVFLGFIWPGFFVSSDGGKVAKAPPKKFTPQKVSAPVQEAVDIFTMFPENSEFVLGGNGNPQRLGPVLQMSGLNPAQVKLFSQQGHVFMAGSIPAAGAPGPMNIVQSFGSSIPLEAQKIKEAFQAEPPQEVQGRSIYKFKSPGDPQQKYYTLPNDQALIVSSTSEADFIKVLEGKGKLPADLQAQVAGLKNATLWGAVNLQALFQKKLFDLNDLTKIPGGMEILPAVSNAKLASFFVLFNKQFQLQLNLFCANDQDAAVVETFAQKAFEEMVKPQLASIGPTLSLIGVGADPVKALIDDLSNAVQIQKQGSVVVASITFSENSFKLVKDSMSQAPIAPGKAPNKAKDNKK